MSQSSQDYNQILSSLLGSHKQWQQIPEIAHLTIKAMFQHIEAISEEVEKNKEFMTEQSVNLRELEMKVDQITNEFYYEKQIVSNVDPKLIYQDGFKKSKKNVGFRAGAAQKSRRKVDDSNFSNFQQRSSVQESGLDKTMIEQVKTIAQAIVESKLEKMDEGKKMKNQLKKQLQENEIEMNKMMKKVETQLSELQISLSRKIIDFQGKSAVKAMNSQNTIIGLMEENFVARNTFNIQIAAIQEQISESAKRNRDVPNNADKQKSEELKAEISIIKKQISELQHKISKELTGFVKIYDIQFAIKRFHEDLMQNYLRISRTVNALEKQVSALSKKQSILHNSNAVPLSRNEPTSHSKEKKNKNNSVETQKNSEKSLVAIKESLQNLEKYFKDKLSAIKKEMITEIKDRVNAVDERIKADMEDRQKYFCQIVEENCRSSRSGPETNFNKMFLKLSKQMVVARYLHFGEEQCTDLITWEKQAYNAMEENFIWKTGQQFVTVNASGLYKVEAGLFNNIQAQKATAFIILNGEPIGILVANQIPKNSKAKARGVIFYEPLLLPAKSRISIRVQTTFYGQAYLQIQQL